MHSRRSPQCPGSLQYGCQCSCCHLITGAVSSSHDDKHFTAFCKGWRERVIPMWDLFACQLSDCSWLTRYLSAGFAPHIS